MSSCCGNDNFSLAPLAEMFRAADRFITIFTTNNGLSKKNELVLYFLGFILTYCEQHFLQFCKVKWKPHL